MKNANVKSEKFYREMMQFIRFAIVGAGNTVIDFGTYYALTRVFDVFYLTSNVFSWLVAVCFSFIMNKYWTFQSYGKQKLFKQYIKFFVVSLIGLGLSVLFLFMFVGIFAIPDLVGKVLSIGVVLFWNFFANKFWTFKHAK